MIAGAVLLALVVAVALWAVLEPLRRSEPADPDAPARDALLADRERVYAELAALDDETRRPDVERRAARTLRALDALPPAAAPGGARRLALAGVALAALVTAAAAVTVVPRWQLAALPAGEAADVRAVLDLPALRERALGSRTNADYLAWGRAAFDSGRYDQALVAYGNALKLDPRQPVALRRLGILLLTSEERGGAAVGEAEATQAALLVRTAARLAPDDAESQLLLGFTLARFGEDRAALAALDRYRTLDPAGRDADELVTALRARVQEADPALRVYAASCASCHGASGGGGLGPDLRASRLSRAALATVIREGRGAMPAYPQLGDADVTRLLDLLEGWQRAAR